MSLINHAHEFLSHRECKHLTCWYRLFSSKCRLLIYKAKTNLNKKQRRKFILSLYFCIYVWLRWLMNFAYLKRIFPRTSSAQTVIHFFASGKISLLVVKLVCHLHLTCLEFALHLDVLFYSHVNALLFSHPTNAKLVSFFSDEVVGDMND